MTQSSSTKTTMAQTSLQSSSHMMTSEVLSQVALIVQILTGRDLPVLSNDLLCTNRLFNNGGGSSCSGEHSNLDGNFSQSHWNLHLLSLNGYFYLHGNIPLSNIGSLVWLASHGNLLQLHWNVHLSIMNRNINLNRDLSSELLNFFSNNFLLHESSRTFA